MDKIDKFLCELFRRFGQIMYVVMACFAVFFIRGCIASSVSEYFAADPMILSMTLLAFASVLAGVMIFFASMYCALGISLYGWEVSPEEAGGLCLANFLCGFSLFTASILFLGMEDEPFGSTLPMPEYVSDWFIIMAIVVHAALVIFIAIDRQWGTIGLYKEDDDCPQLTRFFIETLNAFFVVGLIVWSEMYYITNLKG